MNKTLKYLGLGIVVLMLLITVSGALAQTEEPETLGETVRIVEREPRSLLDTLNPSRLPNEAKEDARIAINESRIRSQIRSDVRGLERAYLYVDNQFALEAMERIMKDFQENYNYGYDLYEGTEVQGVLVVKGYRQVNVLGLFNLNFEDYYELSGDGEITRENRSFLSRLIPRRTIER